jgi:hypothetical protein
MIKNFRTIYGSMPFGYVGNWAEFYREGKKEEIKKALKRLHQLNGLTWADIYEPQIRTDGDEVYCSYGWGQSLEAEKMPVAWYEIFQVVSKLYNDEKLIKKILTFRLSNFLEFNKRFISFIERTEGQDELKRHLIALKIFLSC